MRIIRGRYQRRQIHAPKNLPVRPTTDMAKESLFNILENRIDFEETLALDLFAGTGNISYELVSRGCRQVTAVDENQACVKFIREVASTLNMNELFVVRSEAFRFLASAHQQYNLIFADPPYDCQHYDTLVTSVFENNLLNPEGGILVVEHSKYVNFSEHPNFVESRKYGKVHFSFFEQ